MTLNDLEWPFCVKICFGLGNWVGVSGFQTKLFENLKSYLYTVSDKIVAHAGILVSSKVRFMWIFTGVCWRVGVKWEWGHRKWRFSLLLLAISSKPSHSRPQYFIVLFSHLVAFHWHWNAWPWMTLNGHFALKSVSSSASNGLAFWLSEKTAWKFVELSIYC